MLYKHDRQNLCQLVVNHDETVKFHRTNTNLFQITVRRPLSCSLTHILEFQFSFSGVVITITPSISLGTKTLLTELTNF